MPGKGDSITTKFKVDISDLKKGITEANKQIKLANAEFKAASAGMDNWAKSSEGINAKLKQLASVLESQKTKLNIYKDQLKAIQDAEQKNGQRADELKDKLQQLASQGVSKTSDEYKKYEKELRDVEKEQLANKTAADNLKVTILNQQAAVSSTEKDIRNYTTALDNLENEAGQAEDAVDDLSDEMDDSQSATTTLTGGFTVMKGALASLVADGIKKAAGALKNFAGSMITTAAEVKAEAAQFEQTFGDMGGEAEAAIGRVASSTGILETRLKTTGAQIYAFARSNGATIPEAMSLMETALMASADSAAYYDTSLEQSSETMMSFLKGNYANDAALGVSATEFTRNAKATELFGKKYNDLTEIQKQQTLLKMVTDSQELSGAMGQASREADGWENVQGNLNEAWRQFKALVGTPFLEALIPVIQEITAGFQEWVNNVDWDEFGQKVQDVADKIIEGFGWIIDNKEILIAGISGIIAAFAIAKIATFVTTMISVVQAIKNAAAAQGLFNAVMNANPIGVVITIIGLLVAAIVLLIQNWDKVKETAEKCWTGIKNAVSGAWDNITGVFSGIGDWFSEKFNDARSKTEEAWSDVKEWASTTWDNIKEGFAGVGDWFKEQFETAKNNRDEAWSTAKTWASTTWSNIKSGFSNVGGWFKETFENAWKKVKEVFSGWGSFFGGLWTTIKNKFSSIGTNISDAISGAVKAGINGVISSIERIINKAIGIINGAISLINKIPGVNVGKVSTVSFPRLEKGGILKKGQVGLLEGSGAEAVVPLERNKYWIKSVAKEMQRQLAADVNSARNAASAINNSNVNNFTQVINAPKSPSRIELYRQTKNLLALKGV